ncbi:MAG: DUF4331 domain-containing protein [Actinomycetota bacterium]|nr:DUF4331 domain-containing protein [Actinomycetota bacterium]MDQ2957346.1 DUF4331 domain-containing protein [Actinomycetota bacterium]
MPGVANASSHREAPLTAADPQIDNTDVYAFTSPNDSNSVTLIANWIPFEEPNGGPNFYPFAAGAHYDINIDSNGDGKADITYRWIFTNHDTRGNNTFLYNNGPVTSLNDPNLLFKQTYTLQAIKAGVTTTIANGTAAPSDVGPASMPNYAALRDAAITPVLGGVGKSYAGQADDPFFLDLRVFDLLYGANLKESGQNTLAGYNVNTIALQLPKSALALNGNLTRNPVIGVWSSTEKQTLQLSAGKATPTGAFVQVSRLGNPLVNEVVVPAGLKDAFNSITPDVDHTVAPVVNRVLDPEVPKLIQSIYGIKAPPTPRKDLQEIFLTGISKNSGGPIQADLNSQLLNQDVTPANFVASEELRLNMSVPLTAKPNRLGVLANDLQGFPNGRRLTDDVVDIELQALEGAAQSGKLVPALAAGDGVNANEVPFSSTFPYIALPHDTAVNRGVNTTVAAATQSGGITMPVGGVDTGRGGTASNGSGLTVPVTTGIVAALLIGSAGVLRRRRRNAVGSSDLS